MRLFCFVMPLPGTSTRAMRNRVSSLRRLREIDPRLGGSSAAAPDEYGWVVQYVERFMRGAMDREVVEMHLS